MPMPDRTAARREEGRVNSRERESSRCCGGTPSAHCQRWMARTRSRGGKRAPLREASRWLLGIELESIGLGGRARLRLWRTFSSARRSTGGREPSRAPGSGKRRLVDREPRSSYSSGCASSGHLGSRPKRDSLKRSSLLVTGRAAGTQLMVDERWLASGVLRKSSSRSVPVISNNLWTARGPGVSTSRRSVSRS